MGKTRYCEDLGHELGTQGRWNMNLKRREDFPGKGSNMLLVCVWAGAK